MNLVKVGRVNYVLKIMPTPPFTPGNVLKPRGVMAEAEVYDLEHQICEDGWLLFGCTSCFFWFLIACIVSDLTAFHFFLFVDSKHRNPTGVHGFGDFFAMPSFYVLLWF